jgi:hypothetical protein
MQEKGKYMKSLRYPARWRMLAMLAALVAVAVAIPVASGASAHAKLRPSAIHRSSAIAPSVPNGHGPGAKPGHGSTCAGGSIAPGTYSWLKITGFCSVDQGVVTVQHDVTVAPNAGLNAAFGGGPALVVGGNLKVQKNGVLVLGCEPEAFTCFNDPDQENGGTLSGKETVFGNLDAHNALAVLVHNTTVGRDLSVHGGGGGVNCNPQDALQGQPAYATFEDLSVGGNATIANWQSCWLGLFRTTVGGNVHFHDNVTFLSDGNEVQTNIVSGNLDCHGDNPAAQQGDSGGSPNIVLGHATGECKALVGP